MLREIRQLWRQLAIIALLFVSACDSQEKPIHDQLVVDGSNIDVPLPQRLRVIEEIDPAAIRVIATVNGVETQLQQNSEGRFSGQISVPAQSMFTVRIDYVELFSGQQLTLARAEKSVTTDSTDTSLSLLREDYDYSSFDFDGDAASNIIERQYNTSPLDPGQSPELVQVEVFAELPMTLNSAGFTNYQIVGTVDNDSVAVDADAGQFRHTFSVLKQDNLTVEMHLVEGVTGQSLTIGQQAVRQVSGTQFNTQNSALVVFTGAGWTLDNDQDADGASNAEELIAGTNLLDGPVSTRIPYVVLFDVPAEIATPQSVFATLEVDGQNTVLNRTGNSYTATGSAEPGSSISLDAQIMDTVQGTALVLATFSGTATPIENGTLQLQGFSTDHDADNDGIQNYLELAQGTDPFSAAVQCTPVTETVIANLTDDAYVQNSRILNNNRLQVDSNRRVSLIRFQFDESQGEITEARLDLTVGTDAGDGLLTVSSIANFDWSDEGGSLTVPTGALAGSAESDWVAGVSYSFSLNPTAISGDTTLILQQSNGNDVSFQSSDTLAPPVLEISLERCP